MDMKDYLKKFGKSFLDSAEEYAKSNRKKTVVKNVNISNIPKKETIPVPKSTQKNVSPKVDDVKPQEISQKKDDSNRKQLRDCKKEFIRLFKELSRRHSPYEVWQDFVTLFACSLSNHFDFLHCDKREKLYLETIKKYEETEQEIFPKLAAETIMALEYEPEQDFLGEIYMNIRLENKSLGQVFTPYSVCRTMASITLGNVFEKVKENGYITITDPCCGAGATLIAGIHEVRRQLEKEGLNFQDHVLVVSQDIDFTVAMMCYIQLSLLGVAAYIKVGDTFSDPMTSDDSLENYWFTPMYFSDVWILRRTFKKLDLIIKEGENHETPERKE